MKLTVCLSQGTPWLLVAGQIDGFWARRFTFAGLAMTEALIERTPERAAAAVREEAAELIATVVERDVPFYDPVISLEAVAGLNRFAQSIGPLPGPVAYEQVVAVRFRDLWRS